LEHMIELLRIRIENLWICSRADNATGANLETKILDLNFDFIYFVV
jgi:hypothetical protein